MHTMRERPRPLAIAIIAVRWQEPRASLDWVAKLDVAHRIVINKGSAFEPPLDERRIRVMTKPNVGREDYTYLDFLLHHARDVTADLFIFSQTELNDYGKTVATATRWIGKLKHAHPQQVASACYTCLGHLFPYMEGFDDPPPVPFTPEPRSRFMCPAWPWTRIKNTRFCAGETFAISRALVDRVVGSRSGAEHVRRVRDEILTYGPGNPTGGYVMERSWQLLWRGPSRSCTAPVVPDCLDDPARADAGAAHELDGDEYRRAGGGERVESQQLVECRNPGASYAAAYLAPSEVVLEADFSDGEEGEPGSGLRLFDPSRRSAYKLRARALPRILATANGTEVPTADSTAAEVPTADSTAAEDSSQSSWSRLAAALRALWPWLRPAAPSSPPPPTGRSSSRKGGATRPQPAFFVEHLSGLDFSIHLSRAERSAEATALIERTSAEQAARACGRVDARTSRWSSLLPNSVALLPYWDGRNNITHNSAGRRTVVHRLHATMCSAAEYFEDVVIGACSDIGSGTQVLEQHGVPAGVSARLVPLRCDAGPYLIYRLMRHAQAELRAGRWRYDFVFYSEADQVVHLVNVHISTLANVLRAAPNSAAGGGSSKGGGRRAYLTPNRLEQIYRPDLPKLVSYRGDHLLFAGPDVHWDNRTFALTNMRPPGTSEC